MLVTVHSTCYITHACVLQCIQLVTSHIHACYSEPNLMLQHKCLVQKKNKKIPPPPSAVNNKQRATPKQQQRKEIQTPEQQKRKELARHKWTNPLTDEEKWTEYVIPGPAWDTVFKRVVHVLRVDPEDWSYMHLEDNDNPRSKCHLRKCTEEELNLKAYKEHRRLLELANDMRDNPRKYVPLPSSSVYEDASSIRQQSNAWYMAALGLEDSTSLMQEQQKSSSVFDDSDGWTPDTGDSECRESSEEDDSIESVESSVDKESQQVVSIANNNESIN